MFHVQERQLSLSSFLKKTPSIMLLGLFLFQFLMQTAFQINLLPFSISFIRRCTEMD